MRRNKKIISKKLQSEKKLGQFKLVAFTIVSHRWQAMARVSLIIMIQHPDCNVSKNDNDCWRLIKC